MHKKRKDQKMIGNIRRNDLFDSLDGLGSGRLVTRYRRIIMEEREIVRKIRDDPTIIVNVSCMRLDILAQYKSISGVVPPRPNYVMDDTTSDRRRLQSCKTNLDQDCKKF